MKWGEVQPRPTGATLPRADAQAAYEACMAIIEDFFMLSAACSTMHPMSNHHPTKEQ